MTDAAEPVDVKSEDITPKRRGRPPAPKSNQEVTLASAPKAAAAPATAPVDPLFSLVERVMSDPTVSIDRVTQAVDLYMRLKDEKARTAFIEAKAAFKANAPDVIKDMENKQYKSMYSSIGNTVNVVNEVLSQYGLDARWDYDQGETTISVTCILKHTQGYSEQVTLAAPPDVSGQKNPIQQIKSTTTYLKLATFEAVTGIASKQGNKDDDGNSAKSNDPPISKEQMEELDEIAKEVNANVELFCKFYKIESFADITVSNFEAAKAALNAKRKKAQ